MTVTKKPMSAVRAAATVGAAAPLLRWGASNRESFVDVVRVLLAILLPPVGVFLHVGIGLHFWINLLLTILGYVPGIIHAIWVLMRK